jgi:hypothetical protein
LPDTDPNAPPNAPPTLSRDGVYKLIAVDFTGDTFGNDWYSTFSCVDIDETTQKAVTA